MKEARYKSQKYGGEGEGIYLFRKWIEFFII